jgi:hypothetical protein
MTNCVPERARSDRAFGLVRSGSYLIDDNIEQNNIYGDKLSTPTIVTMIFARGGTIDGNAQL